MSDTPRTTAAIRRGSNLIKECKDMERELRRIRGEQTGEAYLKHRSEAWYCEQIKKLKDASNENWDEIAEQEQQLAEARAEIEKLKGKVTEVIFESEAYYEDHMARLAQAAYANRISK